MIIDSSASVFTTEAAALYG